MDTAVSHRRELSLAARLEAHIVVLAGSAEDELRFLQSLATGFSQCLAAVTSYPFEQQQAMRTPGAKDASKGAGGEAAATQLVRGGAFANPHISDDLACCLPAFMDASPVAHGVLPPLRRAGPAGS